MLLITRGVDKKMTTLFPLGLAPIFGPLIFAHPQISRPFKIFAHPYFTVNLPFFHSFVAFFLLPLICAFVLPKPAPFNFCLG